MAEVILEGLKRYGLVAIVAAVILGAVIWVTAHLNSAPGAQISVLWGLVSYTKEGGALPTPDTRTQLDTSFAGPISGSPPVASLVGVKLKPYDIEQTTSLMQAKNAVSKIRQKYSLRQLNPMEAGKPVSAAPKGTYFFLLSVLVTKDTKGSLNRIEELLSSRQPEWTVPAIEVHRDSDGELFMVAFANDVDVPRITSLSGGTALEVTLVPEAVANFTNLVRIPLQRAHVVRTRQTTLEKGRRLVLIDATLS